LALVSVAGIVTVLILAWAFRRMVLRPLQRLHRAATDLGQTGTTPPVPILSRDEFGQLTHAFNGMADRLASHRQDLEQRVEQRSLELIRTARLADLGTIAAGIAHEINNPLASIAAGVEGLQRELTSSAHIPPATLEYFEIVVKEAYRAKEIAARLLRFGRQERRPDQPLWLEHEAREVVSMLTFQAEGRGITIELDFPDGLPPIHGDPGEWRQVFFNLLRNALDASPDASVVRVAAAREAGSLLLRVQDHGSGFDPVEVDRVFEPFFTTKDPGEGTGLGLAIVERIVRDNRGSIRATNWAGGGEIQIRLPWPTA
jgi:signal transduction histidine kinase